MAKQKRSQSSGSSRKTTKSGVQQQQSTGSAMDFTKSAKSARSAQQPAPKAQPKPKKKMDMDAAVEEATPANVMWKLGILACLAMIILSLLFASINGGSVYVGSDAKPTPTPPLTTHAPDEAESSPDVSTAPDGTDTGDTGSADGQDTTE